ncbi:DUF5329 family protein [Pontibacter sp. JH31]|uniref:DUF5329 family protein n=1 Tax=Pontibacter aquaedesilientis TaxID=2766980 RepID=A0ABR7XJ68_9BACT|nr:DUF5329 family protein [Pontibacter aquaedesilientis]MBD1398362.1 DUF5329 family protein [Pontibacter aquaedesilientis]
MLKVVLIALALFGTQGAFQYTAAQAPQYTHNVGGSLSEGQKVAKLLQYIRGLEGATFIRNNSEYDPKKAASHLESKWQKHGEKVKTAEGFILKLASASSSGTPYSIRFADGKTVTTREALLRELRRLDGNTP